MSLMIGDRSLGAIQEMVNAYGGFESAPWEALDSVTPPGMTRADVANMYRGGGGGAAVAYNGGTADLSLPKLPGIPGVLGTVIGLGGLAGTIYDWMKNRGSAPPGTTNIPGSPGLPMPMPTFPGMPFPGGPITTTAPTTAGMGGIGKAAGKGIAQIAKRIPAIVGGIAGYWAFDQAMNNWVFKKGKAHRTMNVLNPKALSRANRRVCGFAGKATPILKQLGYQVSTTRKISRGGKKKRRCS